MRKSIIAKLVTLILFFMSAGTFVMVVVAAFLIIGDARTAASCELQLSAKNYANEINTRQKSYETKASALASSLSALTTADRQDASNILRLALESDPAILGSGAVFETGAWDGRDQDYTNSAGHDSAGRFVPYWNRESGTVILDSFQEVSALEFYQLTKQTKKPVVLNPYLVNGTWVTSFTAPILTEGQFIGVVSLTVSLGELDAITSQISVLNSGYALMVSQDGQIVFFPKLSTAGTLTLDSLGQEKGIKSLSMVGSDLAQGKGGSVTTQDPTTGKPAVMFFEPIATGHLGLVLVAPAREMTDSSFHMITILVGVGLVGLLAAGILTAIGVSRIISPLKSIRYAANTLAEGNLNVAIIVSSQDEIGQLSTAFTKLVAYLQRMARTAGTIANGDLSENVALESSQDELGSAFNRMQNNLGNLIKLVSDDAASLQNASQEMASAAGQSGQATSQISTTIQEMALGMNQLADNVAKTAHSVEQMSRSIDLVARGAMDQAGAAGKASEITEQIATAIHKVAENAGVVTGESKRAADIAQAGAERVRETISEMENIKSTVGNSASKVKEMGERSNQIATIVEMIDEIAAQTNMLALNAAIEAARAGIHGKGFAVVADEVRKLADRSSRATQDIDQLILSIQKTVEEAVTSMDEGSNAVSKGVERAYEAGKSLQEILQAVQMVNQRASGTLGAAEKMKVLSDGLVMAVDTVTAVIEENNAATGEMTGASNEVSKAIENIASISEQNSAASEEVSASTEELNAQARELVDSAAALQKMAYSLQESVGRFKFSVSQEEE